MRFALHALTGLFRKTMIKRNIFTKRDIRDNGILDLILALAIAGGGLILALAYFDVLVK